MLGATAGQFAVGFAGIRRGSDVAPCGFGFSEVLSSVSGERYIAYVA